MTQIVHSNDIMLFLKQNNYQRFYGALLLFIYFFLQGKVLCFSMRWRDVCSEDLVEKNYISDSTWHKSFIQMVKYSFPDVRIVYWSLLKFVEYKHQRASFMQLINYKLMQLSAVMCNIHVRQSQTRVPNKEDNLAKQRDLDPCLQERQTANNRTFAFCHFLKRKRSEIRITFFHSRLP